MNTAGFRYDTCKCNFEIYVYKFECLYVRYRGIYTKNPLLIVMNNSDAFTVLYMVMGIRCRMCLSVYKYIYWTPRDIENREHGNQEW